MGSLRDIGAAHERLLHILSKSSCFLYPPYNLIGNPLSLGQFVLSVLNKITKLIQRITEKIYIMLYSVHVI